MTSARLRIDQVLAGFAEGDAISHEATLLRELFRKSGFDSEIFADLDHVAPGARGDCRPLGEARARSAQAIIHHYSSRSPAVDVFLASPSRKVLIYHNITPADYYRGFDDKLADDLDFARRELTRVAQKADAVWADSQFNAEELETSGVRGVRVFALPFSPASVNRAADPGILNRFRRDLTNIFFVGRLAPNKRVEDLILAFAWYHRTLDARSRLILVGSPRSAPSYYAMLRMLAAELELDNVCFEGYASTEGLAAYYQLADVFVTASAHEGYCLPLVEAMHHGVPVIARGVGGVPEALGGAGVMYDDLSPGELAELIHRIVRNPGLRNEVLASQEKRMTEIRGRDVEGELRVLLREILLEII